jgi:hypothetical protein
MSLANSKYLLAWLYLKLLANLSVAIFSELLFADVASVLATHSFLSYLDADVVLHN